MKKPFVTMSLDKIADRVRPQLTEVDISEIMKIRRERGKGYGLTCGEMDFLLEMIWRAYGI